MGSGPTATAWPIAPMKAASGALPASTGWILEPKWDGHRALVMIHPDGTFDAVSSTGQPRAASWPWLASVVDAFPGRRSGDWVVDGEVIAMDDTGRHSFQAVGRIDRAHAFVAFDLLVADGESLLRRPWHERRDLLVAALRPGGQVMLTPVSDDAEAMLVATRNAGFEGVVAKRTDSTYQPGRRSPNWRKVKHRLAQEVVVGGFLAGTGARASRFGSLLVGVHDTGVEGGPLRFAGAVGTGFDEATLRMLHQRLVALVTPECPFDPVPKLPRGTFTWVRPELVAQVQFAEWTEGGHLRHPAYLGLRDDKPAADVVREPT